MGGCATKTMTHEGPEPSTPPAEVPAVDQPADVAVATEVSEVEAEGEQVEEQNKEEELLVDLSTPKAADAVAAEEAKLPSELGELKADADEKEAMSVEPVTEMATEKVEEVVEVEVALAST